MGLKRKVKTCTEKVFTRGIETKTMKKRDKFLLRTINLKVPDINGCKIFLNQNYIF